MGHRYDSCVSNNHPIGDFAVSLPIYQKYIMRYVRRMLLATDEFLNALTGGDVGDTISERSARLRDKGVLIGCIMCKFLDLFQKNHCDIVLGKIPPPDFANDK